MKKRRSLKEEDQQLAQSFHFIAGTFIIFYLSFVPIQNKYKNIVLSGCIKDVFIS